MGNKIRRRGFSLVEILMVILVMGVIAAIITISPNVAKQSAKSEAERVVAYIYRLMQKADKTHVSFNINAAEDHIWVKFEAPGAIDDNSFKPSPGCKYVAKFDGNRTYNPYKKVFTQGATIEVNGADGETLYIKLATATEGRVRITTDP
ncbi:MAG: type II secretion system protein [Synergistaceae bacterium]|nr:type II secretion system protein [Synergistaceae bacterium]